MDTFVVNIKVNDAKIVQMIVQKKIHGPDYTLKLRK